MEKIKFLNAVEITVGKLKEINHIIALLCSLSFLFFLPKVYSERDALFGFISGIVLTFGLGYFILHSNYEKLEKLYSEEKKKNKEWEMYRNAALNSMNSDWTLLDGNKIIKNSKIKSKK